jgi:hypothetical protein
MKMDGNVININAGDVILILFELDKIKMDT